MQKKGTGGKIKLRKQIKICFIKSLAAWILQDKNGMFSLDVLRKWKTFVGCVGLDRTTFFFKNKHGI